MIQIEKVNEAHIRVLTDQSTFQELHDFFTFEVPGARFTPQYKARLWDGKIRLLDANRKTLYSGLLKYIKTYAEENSLEVKLPEDDHTAIS